MSIEKRLENIKEDLDFFDEELAKYEYIIDLGKKLPAFDEKNQKPEEDQQRYACQTDDFNQTIPVHAHGHSNSPLMEKYSSTTESFGRASAV